MDRVSTSKYWEVELVFPNLYMEVNSQGPQHNHHPQDSMAHPPMHDVFPPSSNHTHNYDPHPPPHPHVDSNLTYMMSDGEDQSFATDDGVDGHNEAGKGNRDSSWHRVKWTDDMVKLLITAVSYTGRDATSSCHSGVKRKSVVLQKKGKWKLISKVMAERGCYVSPQQCEDKFNELNRRYKRLTDILGQGTSCKVVANPVLLDLMSHLSNKAKNNARKILSLKQLFYEEMCSYHNGNRLCLPADPALQRSLLLAIGIRDEHDTTSVMQDVEDDDEGGDAEDSETDSLGNGTLHSNIGVSGIHQRMKHGLDPASQDCNGSAVNMNQEVPNTDWGQKQCTSSRLLLLQQRRLQIQVKALKLKQQSLKWQRFRFQKDMKLEKMKLKNERMKLENAEMGVEIMQKQLEIDLN